VKLSCQEIPSPPEKAKVFCFIDKQRDLRIFESKSIFIIESSRKTVGFGLKPGNWQFFNCPDLKVGAINIRNIQGFSHIHLILDSFLDQSRG
jgi:hypothetical protein